VDCVACMYVCLTEPRAILSFLLCMSVLWNMGWFSLFNPHSKVTFMSSYTSRGEPMRPQLLSEHVSTNLVGSVVVGAPAQPMNRELMRCLNLDALWRSDRLNYAAGRKSPDEERLWVSLNCEKQLANLKASAVAAPDEKPNANGAITDDSHAKMWCLEAERKYQVLPGRSWGWLPSSMQRQWQGMRCDCYTEHGCDNQVEASYSRLYSYGGSQGVVVIPKSITPAGIWEAVANRSVSERIYTPAKVQKKTMESLVGGKQQEIIAILVPSTSRAFRWVSIEDSPVVRHLLPSVLTTVEEGFK
jgi:hypothetical protein